MIKEFEGFSAKPYQDYGQWTVGYGTRVPDGNLERYQKEGISEEEATQLLLDYMQNYGDEVNRFLDRYELKATQSQFDALLSLSYNCGTGWLYQTSTLRSAIIERKTGNDLIFAMGQWSTAGGAVNKHLVKRRMIEINMYLNGVYSMDPPANYCYVLYDANGGERDVKVQCFDGSLTDKSRSVPTRPGYVFAGWYTQASGGERIQTLTAELNGKTLYAHWKVDDGSSPVEPDAPVITPVNVTVTVAGDAVNIRTGPGTNYSSIKRVYTGAKLDITAVTTVSGVLWGQCSDGWICLEFTNYHSVAGPTEPTEPETEPTEPETEPTEPEEEEFVPVTVMVTGDYVNIRSGPGTNYSRVDQVNTGTELVITETAEGSGYLWGKSSIGWICLEYTNYNEVIQNMPGDNDSHLGEGVIAVDFQRIRSGAGIEHPILGFLRTGDKVNVLEKQTVDGVAWGKIESGWILLDYVRFEHDPDDIQSSDEVEGHLLRIHSGAGSWYSVAGYIAPDKPVRVLEYREVNGTTWGRVSGGWIDMAFVSEVVDADSKPEEDATETEISVTDRVLMVRRSPDMHSAVVGVLYSAETVRVLETQTVDGVEWVRVRQGWIPAEELKS